MLPHLVIFKFLEHFPGEDPDIFSHLRQALLCSVSQPAWSRERCSASGHGSHSECCVGPVGKAGRKGNDFREHLWVHNSRGYMTIVRDLLGQGQGKGRRDNKDKDSVRGSKTHRENWGWGGK